MPTSGVGVGRGCCKHLDSRGHFPFGARRPRESGLRQRPESRFDPGGSGALAGQLLAGAVGRGQRGLPRPGTPPPPSRAKRASPGVLLFLGSEGRAAGLRGTPTCIYLHRGDNKRPCRPSGQGPRSPTGRGARARAGSAPLPPVPAALTVPVAQLNGLQAEVFDHLLTGAGGAVEGMIQARHLHFPKPLLKPPASQPGSLRGPGGSEGREREGEWRRKEERTATRRGGVEARAAGLENRGRDGGCGRSSAGSVRLRETERDLARGREARAPGGEGTRSARNGREEARRGARTLARGRAHLPARGARTPARTRPRLPSRHGPRNPAGEASDGRARGNGWRPGCRVRAHLALAPGEGDLASFPSSQCQLEPRLALRRFCAGR